MTKIRRALGLLLAVGLLLPASPFLANADVLKWSRVGLPAEGKAGNWVLAQGSEVKHLTMAADGTLYVHANPAGTSYTLFKSGDGGLSWKDTGKAQGTIVAIAAAPGDASVIYYASSDRVFKSSDAGESFAALPGSPGGAGSNNIVITSLDITRVGNKYIVAVGTKDSDAAEFGGVYFLDENVFLGAWTDTGLIGYDVYALAFPPTFTADRGLVTIASDETNTVVSTMLGSGWGARIGNATIGGIVPVSAAIAFPEDYDAAEGMAFFIGIDTGTGNGDAYRINTMQAPSISIVTDLGIGVAEGNNAVDVTSLTVSGNAASAALLAGSGSDGAVYASHDGGITWKKSVKPPTGTRTWVLAALTPSDFPGAGKAYAATSGPESAFSISADGGNTWHQASLIDTAITGVIDLAPSPDYSQDGTLFLLTAGAKYSLWRTHDGGAQWERVLSTALSGFDGLDMVGLSPQYGRGSRVVFVAGTSGGNPAIWRSTDDGRTFDRPHPSLDPTSGAAANIDYWAILDDNTLFVASFDGSHGLVYRASFGEPWYSAKAEAGKNRLHSLVLSPDFAKDRTLLAGNTNGEVYLSTDGGASFEPLPLGATIPPLSGNISVAFDPDFARNRTVYAGSDTASKGIYRFVRGESTGWVSIDSTLPAGARIGQLAVSTQGVLYAVNTKTDGGVERGLSPTSSSGFERVTSGLDAGVTLKKLWVSDNRLWTIDATNNRLLTLVDTLGAAVSLTSPPDKAAGTDMANLYLDWETLPGATSYRWQLSDGTDFSGTWEDTESSSGVGIAKLPALKPGMTYFWRVRAEAPLLGPWSGKRSFTTTLGGEPITVKLSVPEAGSGKVSARPVFQWQPVAGAEMYELQVARDSLFARTVISKTGDAALPATAWQSDVVLDQGTTYYWKVRAVGRNTSSAWSAVSAFTTEAAEPALANSVHSTPPVAGTTLAPAAPTVIVTVVPLPASQAPVFTPLPPATTTIVITQPPPIVSTPPVPPAPPAPSPPPSQPVAPGWVMWLVYLGSGLFLVLLGILVAMLILTVKVWRRP
ncbi:MAG: hypothetical protein HY670_07890 [Chloroflexi bacterium]|nr:hypothetical protein [Chloroflexota bacterium]